MTTNQPTNQAGSIESKIRGALESAIAGSAQLDPLELAGEYLRERQLSGIAPGSLDLYSTDGILSAYVEYKLEISKYSGERQLSPDDLGLDPQLAARLRSTSALGRKYILPLDLIKRQRSLDSRARQAIARYSVSLGAARLVPIGAIEPLDRQLSEIESELSELADRVASERESWIASQRSLYGSQARELADRLVRAGALPEADRESWIAAYVDRIFSDVPSAGELRAAYTWQVERSLYLLPSLTATYAAASAAASGSPELARIAAESAERAISESQAQARELQSAIVYDLASRSLEKLASAWLSVEQSATVGSRIVHSLGVLSSDLRAMDPFGFAEVAGILRLAGSIIEAEASERDPFACADRLRAACILALELCTKAGIDTPDYTGIGLPREPSDADRRFAEANLSDLPGSS